MKAANRFKTLIERKRPDIVQSILGHASRIVKPPLSMYRGDSKAKEASKKPIADQELQAAQQEFASKGDHKGVEMVKQLHRLPAQVRAAVVSSNQDEASEPDSHESIPPSKTAQKSNSYPANLAKLGKKGQAHDPLEDQVFVNIGLGPAEFEEDAPPSATDYAVSESPPPIEMDVFERAYDDEVDKIYQTKGKAATVYLTRRVERKMGPKIQRASANATSCAESANAGIAQVLGNSAAEKTSRAGEAAKGRFANLVGKAFNTES